MGSTEILGAFAVAKAFLKAWVPLGSVEVTANQ
jgi:hypothetical protein